MFLFNLLKHREMARGEVKYFTGVIQLIAFGLVYLAKSFLKSLHLR